MYFLCLKLEACEGIFVHIYISKFCIKKTSIFAHESVIYTITYEEFGSLFSLFFINRSLQWHVSNVSIFINMCVFTIIYLQCVF